MLRFLIEWFDNRESEILNGIVKLVQLNRNRTSYRCTKKIRKYPIVIILKCMRLIVFSFIINI